MYVRTYVLAIRTYVRTYYSQNSISQSKSTAVSPVVSHHKTCTYVCTYVCTYMYTDCTCTMYVHMYRLYMYVRTYVGQYSHVQFLVQITSTSTLWTRTSLNSTHIGPCTISYMCTYVDTMSYVHTYVHMYVRMYVNNTNWSCVQHEVCVLLCVEAMPHTEEGMVHNRTCGSHPH